MTDRPCLDFFIQHIHMYERGVKLHVYCAEITWSENRQFDLDLSPCD